MNEETREQHKMALLALSLEVAVPLWIDRLAQLPWAEVERWTKDRPHPNETDEQLRMRRRARIYTTWELLLEQSAVLSGGGRPGEATDAFNAVARGLATLAFLPGGIEFLGMGWVAKHPDLAAGALERVGG